MFSNWDANLLGGDKVLLPNGQNIEDYVAPYDIPKKFVYYLAGYDYENRPVWVAELGKWPVKEVLEEKHVVEFDWHLKQMLHRFFKSVRDRSTEENGVDEIVCIIDFADQKLDQIAHIPAARYALHFVPFAKDTLNKYVGQVFVLNTNFAAQTFLNLLQPLFGGVFGKIAVYGNNKAQWIPKLLRTIPSKSLPEWYGGTKEYAPV
ncbi:unnamed protein product [Allacma fusca]|uniref:CRAL-TRIO domain-containing protein n=1 Tax=Allacma fusca TaxID=39272 RepID=A0A8J2JQD1_9HEXA|nr:unnamed protein product [Allacma fusca]